MADIKFLGEFSGFVFEVDGKVHEVSMTAAGLCIVMEPDIMIGEYRSPDSWEKFEVAHPEFAQIIKQVIQRKMNETIDMINRVQCQQVMPEVMPVPPKIKDDDCMFHRSYA